MTYTEQAIQLSIEGGYKYKDSGNFRIEEGKEIIWRSESGSWLEIILPEQFFLDPLFWQALGKGLSNDERAIGLGTKCYQCAECKYDKPTMFEWLLDFDGDPCPKHLNMAFTEWLHDEKSAESFFESLINVMKES